VALRWMVLGLALACTDGGEPVQDDTGVPDGRDVSDTDGPSIAPRPLVVNFGDQRMGREAIPKDVWIENTSPVPLEFLDAFTFPESQGFFMRRNPTGFVLEPEATARIVLRWRPLRLGDHEGQLVLDTTANPSGAPLRVQLLGRGIAGALRLEPAEVELPRGQAARVPITLSNQGEAAVQLTAVGESDNPGLSVDLNPSRNGELPLDLAPTDPDSGLPVRTVYLDYDPALDDGPAEVSFSFHNDGYLDPERTLTVRLTD